MINITQVNFPLGQGAATKILIQVNSFPTNASTAQLYYALFNNSGKILFEDNYTLTQEEYENWGEDNTYLEDIILEKLNLARAI